MLLVWSLVVTDGSYIDVVLVNSPEKPDYKAFTKGLEFTDGEELKKVFDILLSKVNSKNIDRYSTAKYNDVGREYLFRLGVHELEIPNVKKT